MSTNSENTTEAESCAPSMLRSRVAPSSMKKNNNRKSRRLTRRAATCSRYGVEAIETPAKKAPTSLLNPKISPMTAPSTAQAIANNISNSDECARRRSRPGSTYRISSATASSMAAPFSSICSAAHPKFVSPSACPKAVRPIITSTTTISWTMRKPTAIRPCRASTSRLSESSFTMMMVLENVSATAT